MNRIEKKEYVQGIFNLDGIEILNIWYLYSNQIGQESSDS